MVEYESETPSAHDKLNRAIAEYFAEVHEDKIAYVNSFFLGMGYITTSDELPGREVLGRCYAASDGDPHAAYGIGMLTLDDLKGDISYG